MAEAEESFRNKAQRAEDSQDDVAGLRDEVFALPAPDVPIHSKTENSSDAERGFGQAGGSRSDFKDGRLPTELVFDDPFRLLTSAGDEGDRPRLRTALPTDVPPGKPVRDVERRDADDKPRVVMALVAIEPEKPDLSQAEVDGWKRPENKELSLAGQNRMQNVQQFSKWMNSNFSTLDADKDGVISQDEIGKQIIDGKLGNGESAPLVVALNNNFEMLMELDDKNGNGITREGLGKLEKLSNDQDFFRKAERPLHVKELTKIFSHLDSKESSGRVTPAEVDAALKRQDLSTTQRQALEDLRAYQNHMVTKEYKNSFKLDGKEFITQDMGGFLSQTPKDQMGDFASYQIGRYASPREVLADGLSYALDHGKDRLNLAKKNSELISQGTDGSCFFIAPLSSMRQLDSSVMDKLMKDNKDGTHTVTFPGNPSEPITVKDPTDAELINWANGRKTAILEKAFSQYYVDKIVPTRDMTEEDRQKIKSPVPSARILGGEAVTAIRLLTGNDAAAYDTEKNSEAELREFLKNAAEKKIPLVADTRYRTDPGLVAPHSYSMRYDASSDSVVLENPVKPSAARQNTSSYPYEPFNIDGGARDAKDDGTFKMSLAELKKNFVRINHPLPGTKADPDILRKQAEEAKKRAERFDPAR